MSFVKSNQFPTRDPHKQNEYVLVYVNGIIKHLTDVLPYPVLVNKRKELLKTGKYKIGDLRIVRKA